MPIDFHAPGITIEFSQPYSLHALEGLPDYNYFRPHLGRLKDANGLGEENIRGITRLLDRLSELGRLKNIQLNCLCGEDRDNFEQIINLRRYGGVYIISTGQDIRDVSVGGARLNINVGYIGAADSQSLYDRLRQHKRELEGDNDQAGRGLRDWAGELEEGLANIYYRYAKLSGLEQRSAAKYLEGLLLREFRDEHEGAGPHANRQL